MILYLVESINPMLDETSTFKSKLSGYLSNIVRLTIQMFLFPLALLIFVFLQLYFLLFFLIIFWNQKFAY